MRNDYRSWLALLLGIVFLSIGAAGDVAADTNPCGPCEPEWAPSLFAPAGLNGPVHALAVFDDGSGPALYAGGFFSTAGTATVNYIAKWDGTQWAPLGSGMNSEVLALAVYDGGGGPALYAGGHFTQAGGVLADRIAKWDGAAWSPLPSHLPGAGVSDRVRALTVFDDGSGPALYVGGDFQVAFAQPHKYIARWDGTAWSAVGTGMNALVRVLHVFDDGGGPALYAGGGFTTAGDKTVNHIAKWDGTQWSSLGNGMNSSVLSLEVFDDGAGPALYAGGHFIQAGSVFADRIAKWDGATWSALSGSGSGVSDLVWALEVFDDGSGPALYMGGLFQIAYSMPHKYITSWDGATWSPLGSGMNSTVRALAVFDDGNGPALYAGGEFTTAGGISSPYIAKWEVRLGCNDGLPCDDGNSCTTSDTCTGGQCIGTAVPFCGLDHYKCYKVARKAGTPRFEKREVELRDQFETKDTVVMKPVSICNPVDKNGEGINNPTTHLVCYKIKDARGEEKFTRKEVLVENQLGEQTLRVLKSEIVCVPSSKTELP